MNISQLTPDQKRTILSKKLPGVIRCVCKLWQFNLGRGWYQCFRNDPLLDANAAQAMEGTLTEFALDYVDKLKRITYAELPHQITYDKYIILGLDWIGDCFATPTQRFDAFLSSLPEELDL